MGHSYIETIEDKKYYVIEINVNRCKTYKGLQKEVFEGLSVPSNIPLSYVNDYLDKWWVDEKNVKIILNNYKKIDANNSIDIIEYFQSIKKYWEQNKEDLFLIEKA